MLKVKKGFVLIISVFYAVRLLAQETNKFVKIGSQVWTTENLNVITFRNGDTIPEAKTDSDWAKAGWSHKPAWCYYNNSQLSGKIYGKLYNWYAVKDKRGLAPKGWHIPTDKEWNILVDYLGGYKSACFKLKSKLAWDAIGAGDNSTGFAGIPSGERIVEFGFLGVGGIACCWSTTEKNNEEAFYLPITENAELSNWFYFKNAGFAVRCIKN